MTCKDEAHYVSSPPCSTDVYEKRKGWWLSSRKKKSLVVFEGCPVFSGYRVDMISRIFKNIGIFCRVLSLL